MAEEIQEAVQIIRVAYDGIETVSYTHLRLPTIYSV